MWSASGGDCETDLFMLAAFIFTPQHAAPTLPSGVRVRPPAVQTPPPPNTLSRSAFCLATISTLALPRLPAWAEDGGTASALVTDKVRLEFVEQVSAEEKRILPLVIGLFGKEAPQAVGDFKQLCAGELRVPCPADVDLSQEVMERGKQSKKASLKGCLGSEALPVTYAYSQIWSVQKGKRIGAGAVQGKFVMRMAPTTPLTESATLSHDAAGLLSVRRGGGTFDFGITTGVTPEADSDFAVIGRVIEGMDSVAAIDAVTVVKAADAFNVDGALDPKGSRGKVCEYANPQPFCAQGKPLRKITLLRASVL